MAETETYQPSSGASLKRHSRENMVYVNSFTQLPNRIKDPHIPERRKAAPIYRKPEALQQVDYQQHRLSELPIFDSPVRNEIARRLSEEITTKTNEQLKENPFLFFYLDMDNLKRFNTEYSEEVGDKAIKSMSLLLSAVLEEAQFTSEQIQQMIGQYDNPTHQQSHEAVLQAHPIQFKTPEIILSSVEHAGDETLGFITGLDQESYIRLVKAAQKLHTIAKIKGIDIPVGASFAFIGPFSEDVLAEVDRNRNYLLSHNQQKATPIDTESGQHPPQQKLPYELLNYLYLKAEAHVTSSKVKKDMLSYSAEHHMDEITLKDLVTNLSNRIGGKRISGELLETYMKFVAMQVTRYLPDEYRNNIIGLSSGNDQDMADLDALYYKLLDPYNVNDVFMQAFHRDIKEEGYIDNNARKYPLEFDVNKLPPIPDIAERYQVDRFPYEVNDKKKLVHDKNTHIVIESNEIEAQIGRDMVDAIMNDKPMALLVQDANNLKGTNLKLTRKGGQYQIDLVVSNLAKKLQEAGFGDNVKQVMSRVQQAADGTNVTLFNLQPEDIAKLEQLGKEVELVSFETGYNNFAMEATAKHKVYTGDMILDGQKVDLKTLYTRLEKRLGPKKAAIRLKRTLTEDTNASMKGLKEGREEERLKRFAIENGDSPKFDYYIAAAKTEFGGNRLSIGLFEDLFALTTIETIRNIKKYISEENYGKLLVDLGCTLDDFNEAELDPTIAVKVFDRMGKKLQLPRLIRSEESSHAPLEQAIVTADKDLFAA